MVQKYEFSLQSKHDGLDLGVTVFMPEQPRGIIQIVHGMAEHRRRYYEFMQFCAENGLAAVIHDHRGHGDSVRKQDDYGYFYGDGVKGLIEDVHMVTEYVRVHYPGLPLTLFGHSMGSMVVRCYMKQYDQDVNGLIVCGSPSARSLSIRMGRMWVWFLRLFQGDHHVNRLVAKQVNGRLAKKFAKEGPNGWVVSDPVVLAAYEEDKKSGFDFTLNGFDVLFTLTLNTYSKKGWQVKNPNVPILFISGADDPCLINGKKFQQAVNFMRKVGYKNVESKLYPGMRHEILNEKGKMEVWNDVGSWIYGKMLGM